MLITRDIVNATFTLIPENNSEEARIRRVLSTTTPRSKITYGGRDSDEQGRTTKIAFMDLVITVPPAENYPVIENLRNIAYMGMGLHLLGSTTAENGRLAMLVTGGFCKYCGKNIINSGRSEWKTCFECVEKCNHVYKKGAIHGGGIDIGVGMFCGICGIAKPDEPPMTLAEHHQAVEDELGVLVIHPGELTEQNLLRAIGLNQKNNHMTST